jgi:hypothetical protein
MLDALFSRRVCVLSPHWPTHILFAACPRYDFALFLAFAPQLSQAFFGGNDRHVNVTIFLCLNAALTL